MIHIQIYAVIAREVWTTVPPLGQQEKKSTHTGLDYGPNLKPNRQYDNYM